MAAHDSPINIPIETLRSVVEVAEAGSLTKAAAKLRVSQPAVTSQIKRIERMLGGALFDKSANGAVATPLGRLVIEEAIRILHSNDKILRMSGAHGRPQNVRFGMTATFSREVMSALPMPMLKSLTVQADNSLAISEAFAQNYLDVAYVVENPVVDRELSRFVYAKRAEPIVWVRSHDFTLSPGRPIPIITWPGNDTLIPALERHGAAYTIVFQSPDFHAVRAAAYSGIGLTGCPARLVPNKLAVAHEYYLPQLDPVHALLLARRETLSEAALAFFNELKSMFFDKSADAMPTCEDEMMAR